MSEFGTNLMGQKGFLSHDLAAGCFCRLVEAHLLVFCFVAPLLAFSKLGLYAVGTADFDLGFDLLKRCFIPGEEGL